jgi:molybdenum cofactor biosynthesis enzyme
MAAIITIFFRILPNFELKVEISNIMLVCKFEINWSTSDKCDLKMAAIAAIMVAILVAIFNMVAKTHKKFRSAPMLQLQRILIFRDF